MRLTVKRIPVLFLMMAAAGTAFAEGRGGKGGATPSQIVVDGISIGELVGALMVFAAIVLGGVYFIVRKQRS